MGFFSWNKRSVSWLNRIGFRTWIPWSRHQMETFSALLAICAGNSPVSGEFPAQRPVTRSFDVSFDLRLNERLSKHNGEAGDLRCHRTHYDVIAMSKKFQLTHCGQVTHICISKLDHYLEQCWFNANRNIRNNFEWDSNLNSTILHWKKIHLKMSSGKWRPFCLGLNVLTPFQIWATVYQLPFLLKMCSLR